MNVTQAFRAMLAAQPASVLLTSEGKPITQAVAVARWSAASAPGRESLRATVQFGPFPQAARFDGALLNVGGADEPLRFIGPVELPAGMTFVYDVEVEVSRDV